MAKSKTEIPERFVVPGIERISQVQTAQRQDSRSRADTLRQGGHNLVSC